jgi:hypothetical protein
MEPDPETDHTRNKSPHEHDHRCGKMALFENRPQPNNWNYETTSPEKSAGPARIPSKNQPRRRRPEPNENREQACVQASEKRRKVKCSKTRDALIAQGDSKNITQDKHGKK